MQNYDTKPSRNETTNGGTKPSHAAVSFPAGGKKDHHCTPGSKAGSAPQGFKGGEIPGKV